MRFSLSDAPPKTLKEIGESLGLTRALVRQIEDEALGKLSPPPSPPIELRPGDSNETRTAGGSEVFPPAVVHSESGS